MSTKPKVIATGVTKKFFNSFVGGMLGCVERHYTGPPGKLLQRIDALESRPRFLGEYERAMLPEFRRGDAVTHDGALWIALNDAPGELPGGGWRLVLQGGKPS